MEDNRKKIIILGGGDNQLPLIIESKKLGYYVILCDFRQENPGKDIADIHYLVNTLNYEEVLDVCKKETPNGIITNSEPAIPIMTKIAAELGLVGNSVKGIETIMSKSQFRHMQENLGLYCPKHILASSIEDILNNIDSLEFPIIIKPCECSGSRGTEKINSFDKTTLENAFNKCKALSRNGKVEIEEFVLMPTLTTIEGDIFINNGIIIWDGLFYTTRPTYAPMVPMTYSIPLYLEENKVEEIKQVLTAIFEDAGIVHGEYNIEGYFNKDNRFFVIEINARQGGHGIPEFINNATGINFDKLLVSTAVGDNSYWENILNYKVQCKNLIKHVVFSDKDGMYCGLNIENIIKDNIVQIKELKSRNEHIEKCINGSSLVAIVDLMFKEAKSQSEVYNKMENLIQVKTQ